MERRDIERCAALVLPVAVLCALVAWPALGVAWALCLLASALWGAANLWALGRLLEAIVMHRPMWVGLLAAQVKLAVLLGGGAALLLSPFFTPGAFLAGFNLVFGVIAVRLALGSRTTGEAV